MSESANFPFILKRGFNRRAAPDDPNLVDLQVEKHFSAPGTPEIRVASVDWSEVFGHDRPLRVEVGFGKSEFLIELARDCPDFNYLGFEYSAKRVRKFLDKVRKAGVTNIRAVCCNISDVVDLSLIHI